MDKFIYHTPRKSKYTLFALIALLLALGVIMLGAYTRLSDAGLGCPDWPGCYGKLVLPNSAHALAKAQLVYPGQPILVMKAWTEMIHRYFAGTLGIFILVLAIWATFRKRTIKLQPVFVPWLLVALVGFQAALGMWTVTLKLLPLVVMGHLMGGMSIAALLLWLTLSSQHKPTPLYKSTQLNSLRPWAIVGLIIVTLQIFLGAWTSTNYAALACPTFPLCHGTLFPHLDWRKAFNFASPIGPNYDGGRLAMQTRVTIQMVHRYGAFFTTAYLLPFAFCMILIKQYRPLRIFGLLILLVLATQVTLGILNIELLLPMWTAVAHNGVAALLLLSIVALTYKLFCNPRGGSL